MSKTNKNSNIINASPTKEFFIHMLTRDVPLHRAIIDLVDNSVDGARRIRKEDNFKDLWIRLEIKKDNFKISDNCGGIPIDIAKEYAFRFGRPKNAPQDEKSIGQFGVGMKRTFFKLGEFLYVESSTQHSKFTVEIDSNKWISNENADDWHFTFNSLEKNLNIKEEQQGTIVEIKQLHKSVSESFQIDEFINRLSSDIAIAHTESLKNGIAISINGIPLQNEPLKFLSSDGLKPAHKNIVYDNFGNKPVKVNLYAGISDRKLDEGGWYIFCNGRMILNADQTNITVWNEDGKIPKYHPDFAYFRGLAYFDSDDSSLLPWTTTKTGVDIDFPLYRAVRQQMIEMTKPVLQFLRKLVEERKDYTEGEIQEKTLENNLDKASPITKDNIKEERIFQSPEVSKRKMGPKMQKIQYSRKFTLVEKVKKALKANSYKEIGEKTFDYYVSYEEIDDE